MFWKQKKWVIFLIFSLAGMIYYATAVFAVQLDRGSYGTIHEDSTSANFQINNQIADPAAGRVTSSNYILDHYYTLGTTTAFNHCSNSILDFDEVQTDCGGSLCQACTFHCSNSIQDYDETGVDCGGAFCSACGGGGGGGGGGSSSITAQVNISGTAYPNRPVTILKDGQIVATVIADSAGNFLQVFPNVPAGTYNFSIYSTDINGIKSYSIVFPVTVYSFNTVTVSNLIIPPTLTVNKSTIKKGDTIIIFGQAAPSSEVSIYLKAADDTSEQLLTKIFSGLTGSFSYSLDTKLMEYKTYSVRAKEKIGTTYSAFSSYVDFTVGTENIPGPAGCPEKGDLNGDCRVNLADFSIAAYWYKRTLSAGFKLIEGAELSDDGKINITDFSIMAYYWTG